MATATIKADANNDLDVIDGRNLAVIEGAAACLQSIKQKTLMRTGEDIYDIRNGVDYLGTIFSQNKDTDGARKSITDAILSCPDTLSVEQLNIDVRGDTFDFEAQVMTTYGALEMRNISNAVKPRAGRPIGAANLPSASERVMSMVSSALGKKFMFDPSDSTTLFQDAAGTIPVTALEQPVGLILDKSGAGMNASMATAARRPTVTARYNEITQSEFPNGLADTASNQNVTVATPIPGYVGALQFLRDVPAGDSFVYKSANSIAGQRFMVSAVFLMSDGLPPVFTGGTASPNADFAMYGGAGSVDTSTYRVTSLGGGLHRVTATGLVTATGSRFYGVVKRAVNSKLRSFSVTAFQVTFGDIITNDNFKYQRVGIASDYDAKGWPVALRFSGSQGLVTAPFNLTATAQIAINAGLTFSDEVDISSPKTFMEMGASFTGSSGRFKVSLGDVAIGAVTFTRMSSVPGVGTARTSSYIAGDTRQRRNVISIGSDCTKTDIALRVDGAASTNPVLRPGTSPTFANAYVGIGQSGAGGDTPTVGMTGLWYGAILISRLQTDTEIAIAEQFYRQKMAVS